MSVSDLLARLERRGVRLELDGDGIRFKAKKGALTPELKSELTDRKAEVVEHLRSQRGRAIVPVPREAVLPLSWAQERIWFLEQMDAGSLAYTVPVAVRIEGDVDVAALAKSFAELVRRNEILRTTCRPADGLGQVVGAAFDPPLEVRDEPAATGAERADAVRRVMGRMLDEPFDLTRGPLLRLELLRFAERDHALLIATHLFVGDGWSIELLLDQLARLYRALARGRRPALPEQPLQYADFAAWQRSGGDGDREREQLEYWRARLSGEPRALDLPTDRPRATVRDDRAGLRAIELAPDLSASVRELAAREGVTPFTVLLTAFQGLLHLWSGQDDVVIGTVISNRSRIETERMLGTFANNLLLRVDFASTPTFRDALQRVQETATGAIAHQDLPFERLVELIELEPGSTSRVPEIRALFIFHQTDPVLGLDFPGARLSRLPFEAGRTKVDLNLVVSAAGDVFEGNLDYSAELFDPDTIDRLVADLETLLAAACADPTSPLADVAVHPPARAQPISRAPAAPAGSGEPAGETEKALAGIWADILEFDGVRAQDNFFDLGGHSLAALKVIARVEAEIGVRLNPGDLMMQTLGQLAASCDEKLADGSSAAGGGLIGRVVGALRRRRD